MLWCLEVWEVSAGVRGGCRRWAKPRPSCDTAKATDPKINTMMFQLFGPPGARVLPHPSPSAVKSTTTLVKSESYSCLYRLYPLIHRPDLLTILTGILAALTPNRKVAAREQACILLYPRVYHPDLPHRNDGPALTGKHQNMSREKSCR